MTGVLVKTEGGFSPLKIDLKLKFSKYTKEMYKIMMENSSNRSGSDHSSIKHLFQKHGTYKVRGAIKIICNPLYILNITSMENVSVKSTKLQAL